MSSVKRYVLITMPAEIRALPYDAATKAAIFGQLVNSIMAALIDPSATNPDEVLGRPVFSADGTQCIVDGLFDVTAYNAPAFDAAVDTSLTAAGLGALVSALEVNEILINQQHLTTTDTTPKINPATGVAYVMHWFTGTDEAGNAILWTRTTQTADDSRAACQAFIAAHWT